MEITPPDMLTPAELVKARKKLGISARELAAVTGTHQCTINRHETGRQAMNLQISNAYRYAFQHIANHYANVEI